MYVDVLKVHLAPSEVGIFFQMTNQLSIQSSIIKIQKKNIYIYRPGVNADTFNIRIRHTETS